MENLGLQKFLVSSKKKRNYFCSLFIFSYFILISVLKNIYFHI